ncbi:MAG: metal-dependent hydrolase [Acidobacteria bacterium]|nr:MAG: metal-dependent hydrolase [Acidobacteriota bacterium]
MPSVGHVAVGLVAARVTHAPERWRGATWATLLVVASCLPDVDVVAFSLGIPYQAPFGHRGALHSLAFAALCGLLLGLIAWSMDLPRSRLGLTAAVVMASHGLLDTLTDGGLGIALFRPFSEARYFAPWRPIPVAPIGRRLLAANGLHLMLHECILFLPLFVVGLWPRVKGRHATAAR